MSAKFFTSIVDEERKKFEIADVRLKDAAKAISLSYCTELLKKESAHLNYNNPEYRCAYLYKYATLHTAIVTKNFRKFVRKKEMRNNLKRDIKICSLSGGPGTDIIGIFKALSVNPHFQCRINQVSVLDICGGWSITFENIISSLLEGKIKGVPDTFINKKKFKHEFIEIDLLQQSLPENIVEIISNADIVCMAKFISVILAKERSLDTIKLLGNLLKPGASVLFIDNYKGNVFESIKDIFNQTGLEIVFGPLHETHIKREVQHNKETFGCSQQSGAKITVVGLIKRNVKHINETFCSLNNKNYNSFDKQDCTHDSVNFDEDDCNDDYTESSLNTSCDEFIQTELEEEIILGQGSVKNLNEMHSPLSNFSYNSLNELEDSIHNSVNFYDCSAYNTESNLKMFCDKSTQTELEDSINLFEDHKHHEAEELSELMKALLDLLEVTEKVNLIKRRQHLCCHCYQKTNFDGNNAFI